MAPSRNSAKALASSVSAPRMALVAVVGLWAVTLLHSLLCGKGLPAGSPFLVFAYPSLACGATQPALAQPARALAREQAASRSRRSRQGRPYRRRC
jgi:hypothetical protein